MEMEVIGLKLFVVWVLCDTKVAQYCSVISVFTHCVDLVTLFVFKILIVLNPMRDNKALSSCSIMKRRRSTAHDVTYSAVSDAWGPPDSTKSLAVEYDGDVSYVGSTPNVDTLLRCLRSPIQIRYSWIDVLCLYQTHKLEKAQRVPIMGRRQVRQPRLAAKQ